MIGGKDKSLEKIDSVEAVKGLPGIGKKIEDKIDEYFRVGKMTEVERVLQDDKYILRNKLMNIYGVGPAKIAELSKKIEEMSNLKVTSTDAIINSLQIINNELSSLLKNYGTENLEDLLLICFGNNNKITTQ